MEKVSTTLFILNYYNKPLQKISEGKDYLKGIAMPPVCF